MFSFQVLNKEFRSQDKFTKHVQSILRKYARYDTVNQEDFVFVRELLNYHPEAAEKIGCGVRTIYVDKATKGTLAFHVKRFDDSYIVFSFHACTRNIKHQLSEQEVLV